MGLRICSMTSRIIFLIATQPCYCTRVYGTSILLGKYDKCHGFYEELRRFFEAPESIEAEMII